MTLSLAQTREEKFPFRFMSPFHNAKELSKFKNSRSNRLDFPQIFSMNEYSSSKLGKKKKQFHCLWGGKGAIEKKKSISQMAFFAVNHIPRPRRRHFTEHLGSGSKKLAFPHYR